MTVSNERRRWSRLRPGPTAPVVEDGTRCACRRHASGRAPRSAIALVARSAREPGRVRRRPRPSPSPDVRARPRSSRCSPRTPRSRSIRAARPSFPLTVDSPRRGAGRPRRQRRRPRASSRRSGAAAHRAAASTPGSDVPPELELSVEVPEDAAPGRPVSSWSPPPRRAASRAAGRRRRRGHQRRRVTLTTDFPACGARPTPRSRSTSTSPTTRPGASTFSLEGQGPEGWTVEVQPSGRGAGRHGRGRGRATRENIRATVSPAFQADGRRLPDPRPRRRRRPRGRGASSSVEITGSYSHGPHDARRPAQHDRVTAGGSTHYPSWSSTPAPPPLDGVALSATPPTRLGR